MKHQVFTKSGRAEFYSSRNITYLSGVRGKGKDICQMKRRYFEEADAQKAAQNNNKKVYKCKYCPGYHLATKK